jgi:iron complex transport system substrate-binding protein
MAPSVTEILYFIGAFDRLVGVDEFSNYPPELQELKERGLIKVIGGFFNPSIEAILDLEPDLVIGVATGPHVKVKEVLTAYGIPVILIPQGSVEDVIEAIIMIGKATGNVVEASRIAFKIDSLVSRISALVADLEKVSVALVVWVEPIFVAGSETFQGDLIETVGGENVFSNLTGWQAISPEDFLVALPEIIIITHINVTLQDFISYLKSLLGDVINEIPAIRDSRVYCIGGIYNDIINRPGPRIMEALKLLLLIIHPEIYGMRNSDLPACITPETLGEIPEPPLPVGG